MSDKVRNWKDRKPRRERDNQDTDKFGRKSKRISGLRTDNDRVIPLRINDYDDAVEVWDKDD